MADYHKREHIPIVKDDRHFGGYGETSFDFATGNGIYRSEQGSQNKGQNTQGQWRYVDKLWKEYRCGIVFFRVNE